MVVISAVGYVLRMQGGGLGALRELTGVLRELFGDVGGVGVVQLRSCRRWPELAKVAAATAFLASSSESARLVSSLSPAIALLLDHSSVSTLSMCIFSVLNSCSAVAVSI